MKTVNYLLLGLCIAMAACKPDEPEMPEPEVPKDEIISGTCGDNLTWTFTTADSTLTISGTGNMYDYNYSSDQPWYNFNQGIKNISIQDGVTSIGNGAFYNCSALTQMDIPNSVTSIGDHAFSNCSALTQVNIPDGVTSIGEDAFNNCEALTQVTIPSSVTSIGKRAFAYCFALTAINVESGNTAYCSENGILFNKDKTTLIQYPASKTGTTYAIPNGVTSIGDYAFYDCDGLAAITIPNSVTSIGSSVFAHCDGLKQVTLPNKLASIEGQTFYSCDLLAEITIPNSVESIGSSAFANCYALTQVTIGNGVESIGDYAFGYCEALTDMTVMAIVPPTVESGAFEEVKRDIPVYVPAESLEAYKAAEGWNGFNNLQAIQ